MEESHAGFGCSIQCHGSLTAVCAAVCPDHDAGWSEHAIAYEMS